jgi:hypothetical protein
LKPVLSHFSSTVFALSWVKAEELLSHSGLLASSSPPENIISKNHTNNFIGFSVNQDVFHFIIAELALLQSHCQLS